MMISSEIHSERKSTRTRPLESPKHIATKWEKVLTASMIRGGFHFRFPNKVPFNLDSQFHRYPLADHSKKSLYIRESLNGFVIIDLDNSLVIKALDQTYEKEFLGNELTANSLVPDFTQRVVRTMHLKTFNVTFVDFIPGTLRFSDHVWSRVFPYIASILLSKQEDVQIRYLGDFDFQKSLDSLVDSIPGEFTEYDDTFKRLIHRIDQQILKCRDSSRSPMKFPVVFCHGDLMPSNLLIDIDSKPILIDWANGGFHNLFYDLAIQDIYNPKSSSWTSFYNLSLAQKKRGGMYSKGTKIFCAKYTELTNLKLSIDTFNAGILLSVKEFLHKNFLRHRNLRNLEEGMRVLGLIQEIISNIEISKKPGRA